MIHDLFNLINFIFRITWMYHFSVNEVHVREGENSIIGGVGGIFYLRKT